MSLTQVGANTGSTNEFPEIFSYITRVRDISMGYPYPQEYKINLGYTFKNVVAVRILNTIIPNVSFMINSSTQKNNKLKWINQCSKVSLPNAAFISNTLQKNFYTNNNSEAYIFNTDETATKVFPHDTTQNTVNLTDPDIKMLDMYAMKSITLHGGTYTPDSLATELEKELNRELVTSAATHEGFSTFSWPHGRFLPRPKTDDTFKLNNNKPVASRFFVSTDNKKRIISIQQCERIFHANNYRLESNQSRVVQSGPLYVNAGIPYLYIRLPGTLLKSGDSLRIAGAFDILNIRDTEINREHRAIVCNVRKFQLRVDSPNLEQPIGTIGTFTDREEHPFVLYEVVYQEEIGLSTFGRIIAVKPVSDTTNEYTVYLEMMGMTDFDDQSKCITQTSNVTCSINAPPVIVDNAHAGIHIKLAHVPTRTILTGIGTEQLFIGIPVAFKFLFGMDENPGEVLGFYEDKSGAGNERINFKKVESNTVEIQKVNIVESKILPTTETEDTYEVSVQLAQECRYSPGDRIYMKNHMPNVNLHDQPETFRFDFTSIVKDGDNTKLYLNRKSFQNDMCPLGKRPDSSIFMPFRENDMVYVSDHEVEVPVYEKDIYIVTISSKKTYSRGDRFLGYEYAIVQETQYASEKFRVQLTGSLPTSSYTHIELARAQIGGQFLYHKQGIPDGVYEILNANGGETSLVIKCLWDTVRTDTLIQNLSQKGIGRANFPKVEYSSTPENNEDPTVDGTYTLNFSESAALFDTYQENILHICSDSDSSGTYFQTLPSTENKLQIIKNEKFPDNETITVRLCSSSESTPLNNHSGFIISSVDDARTKITFHVPKQYLSITMTNTPEANIAQVRYIDGDGGQVYGHFGEMFMKEVDKPYIVSDNFMYLKCPTLSTIKNTETSALHDIFAKILLPGKTGSFVFDTFVSTPKVFNEHPLRELHELAFHFVNKHGDTVDFNEMDHSIVLEIVEAVERLERLNVQMSQ
jgi:hypothetical protein